MFDHLGVLATTWRPTGTDGRTRLSDVYRCRHCLQLLDGHDLDGHSHDRDPLTFVFAGPDDTEQDRAATAIRAAIGRQLPDDQVVAVDVSVDVRPLH